MLNGAKLVRLGISYILLFDECKLFQTDLACLKLQTFFISMVQMEKYYSATNIITKNGIKLINLKRITEGIAASSVTRFGVIGPLWQNFTSFWPFLWVYLAFGKV